ncbi:MAG: hypothetical protein EOM51_00675 [Clostridia bacterium]|nr:hypothetical protein [Clostridia bacterium]
MCVNDNHSHEHNHGHEHEAGQEHCCCGEHTHEHGHSHEHCCSGEQKTQSAVENMALLNYMIDHNRHHNEDLHELLHSLEASGKNETAALVAEAMHFYEHGTEKLEDALELLGK